MTDIEPDANRLFASLELSISSVGNEVKRMREESNQWRSLQESPRFQRIHATTILSATGFGVLRCDNDGPDLGRVWYLRKLVIGGVTPATTIAGRGDLFVSAMDLRIYTSLAQFGTQDWIDQAASLPLVGSFSPGECVLQNSDQLFVIVSGGTAGQEVHCSGLVEDFQASSYRTGWSV